MDKLVIARIGKPHGLRGEVTVQEHTDDPDARFAPGVRIQTDPEPVGPLTVRSARRHKGILMLGFDEVTDRSAAEALRGTRLVADSDSGVDDDEGWYEDELVGLDVLDTDGTSIGQVAALHTRPAQDLLEVTRPDGSAAFLPLVEQIVLDVDPAAGRVLVDPPAGLLDLDG